jgi:predicted HTH domain antitoxin
MAVEVPELVRSGIYPNADVAVREALRVLWQERPGVRIDVAVHHYRTEEISIARAAALAGVSFDRMKELLAERGVPLRLGPETLDEARAELGGLQRMRR